MHAKFTVIIPYNSGLIPTWDGTLSWFPDFCCFSIWHNACLHTQKHHGSWEYNELISYGARFTKLLVYIFRIKKGAVFPPSSSCRVTVMTLLSGWHFLGSFSPTLSVTWHTEDTRVLWVAMTMPQEMQRERGERGSESQRDRDTQRKHVWASGFLRQNVWERDKWRTGL